MLKPTPELRDDMPISDVELSTRIRNVLEAAGLKSVGDVRETSDEMLLSFQDLGKDSVTHLRETLGLERGEVSLRGQAPFQSGAAESLPAQLRNMPGDSGRGLFYVARRLQSSAGHIPNDVARKVRRQQALKA